MRKAEQIDLKTVVFNGRNIWIDAEHNEHQIKDMDSDYIKNCVHYIIRKRDSDNIQCRIPTFKDYIYTFLCELADRKEYLPHIEWVDWKPIVWYENVDFVYLRI